MESERIIFIADFIDFSEDEEPPSRCESKMFTFAFGCYRISVLKLNSTISSIRKILSFYGRELFSAVELLCPFPKIKGLLPLSLVSLLFHSNRMVECSPMYISNSNAKYIHRNHWATVCAKNQLLIKLTKLC